MKIIDLSKPTGTYVCVQPTSGSRSLLEQWIQKAPVQCLPLDYLHATLLYSRKVVNTLPSDVTHFAEPAGFDIFDGYLVLMLKSDSMYARHGELRNMGGTHDWDDWDDFKLHMSLAQDVPPDLDLSLLEPIKFGLSFDRERHEPLIV